MHQPALRRVAGLDAVGARVLRQQVVASTGYDWPLSVASVRATVSWNVWLPIRNAASRVMSLADEYWPSASSPVTLTACVLVEPEGGGLLVHQLGELRLAAGDVDGQQPGRVVGADDEHRPDEQVAGQLLARR